MNTLPKIISNTLIVIPLIVLALGLRLYKIDTRPGYEWDEPVYSSISSNYLNSNYPVVKLEGNQGYGLYLYHPPFDYLFKSIFLKYSELDSITTSRIVSALASTLILLFIYFFVKRLTNTKTSIIATLLIATDVWLIYTNRLNLIENEMFLLGIISLAFYLHALKSRKIFYYMLAGILIGITVVYKHTGVCFLLVPLINLFFTRKDSHLYKYLYIAAFLIVLLYSSLMYLTYQNVYIDQTIVQIKRTFGIFESRGAQYTLIDAIKALFNTYWIYFSTIAALIVGVILVIINTTKFIVTRITPKHSLFLSWCLATLIFFGAISLKAPQYLIMLLIPLYLYIFCYFSSVISLNKYNFELMFFTILILLINTATYTNRFIFRSDNALLETYNYMNSQISQSAVVLTEESVGVGIKQAYYKLDIYNSKQNIEKIKPSFVVVYLSSTQKLPESPELDDFIKQSNLIKEIHGFKERIYIYKTEFDEIAYRE